MSGAVGLITAGSAAGSTLTDRRAKVNSRTIYFASHRADGWFLQAGFGVASNLSGAWPAGRARGGDRSVADSEMFHHADRQSLSRRAASTHDAVDQEGDHMMSRSRSLAVFAALAALAGVSAPAVGLGAPASVPVQPTQPTALMPSDLVALEQKMAALHFNTLRQTL